MRVVFCRRRHGFLQHCMYDARCVRCARNITVVSCDTPTGPVVADPGPGRLEQLLLPGPNRSPGEEHVFSFAASTTGNHLLDCPADPAAPWRCCYKGSRYLQRDGWTDKEPSRCDRCRIW